MPLKPLQTCKHPACAALTREGWCEAHRPTTQTKPRPTASARGYNSRWRKARKSYLKKHPWCVMCEQQGRRIPAEELDHIIPHKGDRGLFWDSSNWQGLCKHHHSQKTAREDGGFGNRRR